MQTPLTPFAPFRPLMDQAVHSQKPVLSSTALHTPPARVRHDSEVRLVAARASHLPSAPGHPPPPDSHVQLVTPAPSPGMALARAAATGDESAVRRLLVLLSPRIGRVVRAILGGAHPDIDDVTQQALLGFVRALPAFRGDCEPLQFASRIAARTAIAAARRARVLRSRRDDDVELDLLTSDDVAPHEAAVAERRSAIVRALLARIPREQADTMVMRVMLGWSLGEVANATGVPVNTVRSRMRLAKNALRSAMAQVPGALEELGPMQGHASSDDGDDGDDDE